MSKEIFVAFATQKGGIGKSTVTALAASYLHNVKGYNVAVVDCDDPQHSIHGPVSYTHLMICKHNAKLQLW